MQNDIKSKVAEILYLTFSKKEQIPNIVANDPNQIMGYNDIFMRTMVSRLGTYLTWPEEVILKQGSEPVDMYFII